MSTRRAARNAMGGGRKKPSQALSASALAQPAAEPAPATPAPGDSFTDRSILQKTSRSRDEWFEILDAFDAVTKGVRAAAAHLVQEHGCPEWWARALVFEYERNVHAEEESEAPQDFDVSVQRALAALPERVWQAWADPKEMAVWFQPRHQHRFEQGGTYRNAAGDRGTFRRILDGRGFRFTWDNKRHTRGSYVTVEIRVRAEDRVTVKLTHAHIGSAEDCEELRASWSRAMDSLKSWIERGEPVKPSAWAAAKRA